MVGVALSTDNTAKHESEMENHLTTDYGFFKWVLKVF